MMNALQIMSPQKNKPDWSRIEMNWLKLPSMFKVFHDNYDLSTVGNYFRFAYTQDGNVETFGFYTHPVIRNIIIDQFFELENLKDQLSISLNLDYDKGTVDQKITHRPDWNLVREEILMIEPSNLLTCKQLRP